MSEPIISKRCSKCKEIKQLSEFGKCKRAKIGRQSYCKKCQTLWTRDYRKCKKCQTYQRNYWQSIQGKTIRKKYRQTKKGKRTECLSSAMYRIRYPKKTAAVSAVGNAIKASKLPHPKTLKCVKCHKNAQEYHHPNYTPKHQLDVIPICRICHIHLHNLKITG